MAQLAIIKQMIGQVSHGSDGDYQADDRAVVTRLNGDYQAGKKNLCSYITLCICIMEISERYTAHHAQNYCL